MSFGIYNGIIVKNVSSRVRKPWVQISALLFTSNGLMLIDHAVTKFLIFKVIIIRIIIVPTTWY